jgi:N-acetylglucosamine kinase-like BadF-type ATPase
MPLFLGVDGGQSSTVALIADEAGRILGRGVGGPCNHVTGAEARQKFIRVVGDCLSAASLDAGLPTKDLQFSAAFLGFSGGSEDKEAFALELISASRMRVTHDAEIALLGALAGSPGIVVISGTGSMAFGQNSAGKTARAGGWGYVIGDEGGAFYLVKQAIRASLQMEEGWGAQTTLRTLLLEAFGMKNANALLHYIYGVHRSDVAKWAPLVSAAAEAGDLSARHILMEAGEQLARYVQGVQMNLFPDESPPVSFVGGTLQSKLLRTSLSNAVLQQLGSTVSEPLLTPAEGAVLGALRLQDIDGVSLINTRQYRK